ncbi:MAG: TPM domain-containing protein [Acidobacteriota bacterium]|nr:TPM domain-containing protein [Acidobacteriota bacterium]
MARVVARFTSIPGRRALALLLLALCLAARPALARSADDALPALTQPVNDFAHVIDAASAAAMTSQIRKLQAATGDAVVVATIPTFAPYGDIQEYAVKLFENHGRGIGEKGKDNGLLILLSLREHRVWIEVGYGLEPYVTDGFSGETSRLFMVPDFRQGEYGQGLLAGTTRIIGRIAQARHVALDGVQPPEPAPPQPQGLPLWALVLIIVGIALIGRAIGGRHGGGPRGGWRGGMWSSGIGMFGGGFGGGFGGFGGFGGSGGGFGGGFGGFGGGASGGGGGGAGW